MLDQRILDKKAIWQKSKRSTGCAKSIGNRKIQHEKVMTKFEEHSRRFIELSPFLVFPPPARMVSAMCRPAATRLAVTVMDDNRTVAIPTTAGQPD